MLVKNVIATTSESKRTHRVDEADGWLQVSQKGSHHPSKSGTVTVAGKPSVDVPVGTLNSVLKQAGVEIGGCYALPGGG